jgi:hypothetical protein
VHASSWLGERSDVRMWPGACARHPTALVFSVDTFLTDALCVPQLAAAPGHEQAGCGTCVRTNCCPHGTASHGP